MWRYELAKLGGLAMAMSLISPPAAQAQTAQPVDARMMKSPRLEKETSLPQEESGALASLSAFRVEQALATSLSQNTKSVVAEVGDVRVMLSASRSKKDHSALQLLSPRPTTGNFAVAGAVEFDLGKSDSIGLFGTWSKERRKPLSLFPSRKYFTSDAQSFSLDWTHNDRFVASLSRFSTGPAGNRTQTERMVDLAGGGMKKATGFALALTSLPPAQRQGVTYGLNVRQQHVAEDSWLGRQSGQNETIGSVFLAFKF